MRILCYLCLTIFSIILMASPNNNELVNTSWMGLINAPDPEDANLKFSEDTLYVYINTQLIETSIYSVNSDTLTLQKISGLSPCLDEIGSYTFKINDDVLVIKPATDICEARYNVFSPLGYKRKN